MWLPYLQSVPTAAVNSLSGFKGLRCVHWFKLDCRLGFGGLVGPGILSRRRTSNDDNKRGRLNDCFRVVFRNKVVVVARFRQMEQSQNLCVSHEIGAKAAFIIAHFGQLLAARDGFNLDGPVHVKADGGIELVNSTGANRFAEGK
ncbi:hypothetical protein LA080_006593 [Diaporthe eres]|nr:hypothetical protein LA080_006593 [Diaporthe eres]